MIGPVKSYLNEQALDMNEFPLAPEKIAGLTSLVESGRVSYSAAQKIFNVLVEKPEQDVESIAQELNLIQESDSDALESYISEAISKYPEKLKEYRAGKTGLIGLFIGEVMKLSGGKADPKLTSSLLKKALDDAG